MSQNATEMYLSMAEAIRTWGAKRQVGNPPNPMETIEAMPFSQFVFFGPHNVVAGLQDRRWAWANTLHFFTGSEEAGVLRYYNRNADRFLNGDLWHGAYGAIGLAQLHTCVDILRKDPASRRAIVTMGTAEIQDINRPCCWTSLQFLLMRDGLAMGVMQRSLALHLMPYDLVALTNIHRWVATATEIPVGRFVWTVGSLHRIKPSQDPVGQRNESLYIDYNILSNPIACMEALRDSARTQSMAGG